MWVFWLVKLTDILTDVLAVYVAQIKHRERRDRDSSDERDPSEPKPDRTGTNHKNNHHRASRDTNDASSSNSSKQQNQQNNDDDSSSMTHDDDSSTKIKESSLIEPTTRRRHRRKKKPDKDTGFESISDKRYFVLCQWRHHFVVTSSLHQESTNQKSLFLTSRGSMLASGHLFPFVPPTLVYIACCCLLVLICTSYVTLSGSPMTSSPQCASQWPFAVPSVTYLETNGEKTKKTKGCCHIT